MKKEKSASGDKHNIANAGGILSIINKLPWPLRFIGFNLYAWYRFPLALLHHPKIKKGDRFIAAKDIEAFGMVHYHAPYTDKFECVIPENTVLVAIHDDERISTGFGSIPENKVQFERTHVPEELRKEPTYASYSIVVRYSEIGKKYRKI